LDSLEPPGGLIDAANIGLGRRAILAGVTALAIGAALSGSAKPASTKLAAPLTGGVFVVTYAPQALSSRLAEVRVRFTTTGRAQSGWQYYAYLVVERPKSKKLRCAHKAASWVPGMVRRVPHISGVAGKTYTVWLRAAKSLGGHFCAGRGVLEIGTAPTGREAHRRRPLRRIPLTIVRAS
jgi:hypothetical protein